ncbi:holin [Aquirhabdus sp.]|uniref:holin n=1 Tax=Aquirhabdus sp. TaxID=2824160 RepID=UPI00396CFC90
MQDYEKNGLMLIVIGALIGLGKVLASNEILTLRLLIGRTLLGSGSSLVAGAIVMQIPDISPLALVGIGSALGIAGASVIEAWVKKKSGVNQ